jgi:hypothetical protein
MAEGDIDFEAVWRYNGQESKLELKATGNIGWCLEQAQKLITSTAPETANGAAGGTTFPKRTLRSSALTKSASGPLG